MTSIPSGTITLLFTDVQGSTRLWEAEPEAMAAALHQHDDVIRAAVTGGYVFKTVGDQFCVAFGTPRQALEAALTAQRALTAQDWPTSRPIRVRMGLHTGETEERDGDYFGPVVNRVARLEAAAHGGQVLLSGVTAALLDDALPAGVTLIDLGMHRLRDLGRPEHVLQLAAPGLPDSFPPLASLDSPELPNNLPIQLSTFIGRDADLAALRTVLTEARLVTLTGAGGCGKTRLALQAAAEQVGRVPDGTWFADLAPVTAGEQIPGVVAAALCVGECDDPSLLASLRDQDTLIVLDNCEHVVEAAAAFCTRVLQECRAVRILATSREPLGIDGEWVYRVASLSLPPAESEVDGDIEEAAASDAVRLFADRARGKDPAFTFDSQTAPLVATLTRRLDGIPLALELAAARLSTLALPQLVERLDQRFRLLTGGSRNAMPRQQTLQATVDWSYSLLHDDERAALRRLSVCVDGFDLDAAAAVCDTDEFETLDLLGSLVSKSLVIAGSVDGAARYRMLETIRQYCGQELLRAEGDDGVLTIRTRHAEHFRGTAEIAGRHTKGPDQARWLRRLDREWQNIRTAQAHLQSDSRTEDIVRIGVALDRFALTRGYAEVADWLRAGLDQLSDAPPTRLTVSALNTLLLLVNFTQRRNRASYRVGKAAAELALTQARELGDQALEAMSLAMLADEAWHAHDTEATGAYSKAGFDLARQVGDHSLISLLLSFKQLVVRPLEEQRALLLEALGYARRAGDTLEVAAVESSLFGLEIRIGNVASARQHMDDALVAAAEISADVMLFFMQNDLFMLIIHDEDYPRTYAVLRQNLRMARRLGMGITLAGELFAAASCAAWKGDPHSAARLHGAADSEYSTAVANGVFTWTDFEQQVHDREQAKAREAIGDAEFEAAYAAGAELTPDQALEEAIARMR